MLKALNISVKSILVLSFVIALTFNIENLSGKGMVFRAPLFIGITLLFPIIGYFKKWKSYPHLVDILVVLPFLLDTTGNFLGLFDTIAIFDDILHFLNWALLITAYQILKSNDLNKKYDMFLLGAGVGALVIIFWELLEWVVSVDGIGMVSGLKLSYAGTIGDLVTSTLGGITGSYIGINLRRPK